MRYRAGTTTVTPGTAVRLRNSTERVLAIEVHARKGNGNDVYFGDEDVSVTNGREIAPDESHSLVVRSFKEGGSVAFNTFFCDGHVATDKLDWEAFYED